MKARRVHDTAYGPDFYGAYLRILTGISWHVFVSIILMKPIRSRTKNSHFPY